MGKQSVDDDNNQVGQILAAVLGWPQATFASKIEFAADNRKANVTREVDGGLETIEVALPAVVTTDLRLNEPRYASLPGIMKAKKKEMKVVPVASLGVDTAPRVKVLSYAAPKLRAGGGRVADVAELVSKLKIRGEGPLGGFACRTYWSSSSIRTGSSRRTRSRSCRRRRSWRG